MNTPLMLANFLGDWGLLIILGIIGLLIFGNRLPEVGRNVGKGIVEFKKGLAGVGDEMKKSPNEVAAPDNRSLAAPPDRPAASEDEMRQMREQMKAMQDELRSTRQALAQAQKPSDSH